MSRLFSFAPFDEMPVFHVFHQRGRNQERTFFTALSSLVIFQSKSFLRSSSLHSVTSAPSDRSA